MLQSFLFIILVQFFIYGSNGQISDEKDDLDDLAKNGDCVFYQHLEKLKLCGPDGYPIGYGFKYCNKFVASYHLFNQDGKEWVNGTKKCLMKKLLPKIDLSCEQLKDYAFETHVECYLNPGYPAKSFCEIAHEFENIIALMRTYEFSDFLSKQALEQIKEVMFKCLKLRMVKDIESSKELIKLLNMRKSMIF